MLIKELRKQKPGIHKRRKQPIGKKVCPTTSLLHLGSDMASVQKRFTAFMDIRLKHEKIDH